MPSNITPQRVPLVDPATGIISREWYNFFLTLFNLTGAGGNDISLMDLQMAPPPFEMGEILKAIAAAKTPVIYFHAYQTAAQNIPAFGVVAKIALDTVKASSGATFDTTLNRFTCVTPGLYIFTAGIHFSLPADGVHVGAQVYVNGVNWVDLSNSVQGNAAGNQFVTAPGGILLNLVAGDYVEIYGYTSAAVSVAVLTGPTYTYLTGALIARP